MRIRRRRQSDLSFERFHTSKAAIALVLCAGLLFVCRAGAQTPSLFVRGLPCPGGAGEPTNAHPIIWQCRCADNVSHCRLWANWGDTIPIGYGDVVSATWYGQCRSHPTNWDFLRIYLVIANLNGSFLTNSSTVKMKAGYNFDVSYIYWYSDNGFLFPTNFDVAEVAVEIGSSQTPVLGAPVSLQAVTANSAVDRWWDWEERERRNR